MLDDVNSNRIRKTKLTDEGKAETLVDHEWNGFDYYRFETACSTSGSLYCIAISYATLQTSIVPKSPLVMYSTRRLLSKGRSSSSNQWLQRQQGDPFVRQRLSSNVEPSSSSFRSRSAFKLLALAKRYPQLLRKGASVVDLGAAPGGWTAVASKAVGRTGRVVGIDLLDVAPMGLKNVTLLRGDFLSSQVREQVADVLEDRQVHTVLSDMMANTSGVRDRDIARSLELCEMALDFATMHLKVGSGDESQEGRGKVYDGGAFV